jgi:parvulin-like peptidyl-prolyl isomerase
MRRQMRRKPMLAALLALAAILMTACSGPQDLASKELVATVGSHTVDVQSYLQLTRALQQLNALQGGSSPLGWQIPAGRQQLATTQSVALEYLILDHLLGDDLARHHASYDKKTIDAEDSQFFAQVQSIDPQLISDGTFTHSIIDLLDRVQAEILQVPNYAKTQVAHVSILSVSTMAKAQALQQQLLKGANWSQLAQQNSTDGAKSVGGDIPSLVPGVLPAAIDQVVFQPNPDLKAITIVHTSKLGYTLVQVVAAAKTVTLASLDSSSPILANTQVSPQGAALAVYLQGLYRSAGTKIYANWCGNPGGQACPTFTFGLG